MCMFRFFAVAVSLLLGMWTLGCGSGVHFPPGGLNPPNPVTPVNPPPTGSGGNVTGNWLFLFAPASGTAVLNGATGSISETGGNTTQGQFTTAVLLVNGPCYSTNPQVPTQGFATGTTLSLNSFADNAQFLTLNGNIGGGGSSMTGTYSVQNGCANGANGTLTGTRYAPLTGSYAGAVSGGANRSVRLALTQSTDPAGDGTFLLSGTGTFTGFGCFANGTTATPVGGNVSGPNFTATFNTDDIAGSKIVLKGTFSVGANSISFATYTIQGGACNGQSGAGTLTAGS